MENRSRLKRVITHLYKGTLIDRILELWQISLNRRRALWWQKQLGKRESFSFKLQPGLKMILYFDSRLCQEIYCGQFEKAERQFLNLYLKPNDIFVDVGANIGLFTLIASKKVGAKGQIYSFEPCAHTFSRLEENIHLNRLTNVQCYQVALSDVSGSSKMKISLDGYDAWNSFVKPTAGNRFSIETVRTITWDDFMKQRKLEGKVALMKIDVEGWESHVLNGGRLFFSRPDAPVLQIEFNEKATQASGTSCESLYRQLEDFGYRMYIYDEKTNQIIPDPLRKSYPYINLFAIKNIQQVHLRLKKGN